MEPLATPDYQPEAPDYAQSRVQMEALGIPPDLPREAVKYAHGQAVTCTDNDVRLMKGVLEYGKPMRFLRDELKPQGWKIGRSQNLESVVSPDYSFAIISSAGNEHIGDPTRMPSTRTEKGPRTVDRINETQLAMALPDLREPRAPKPTPGALQSWFLLYFRDPEKQEIRMELSRGVGFTILNQTTGHGVVSDFEPRLFIEPIALDAQAETSSKRDLVHEDEHYEAPVARRTG